MFYELLMNWPLSGHLPHFPQDLFLQAADLHLTDSQDPGDLRLGLILKIAHTDQLPVSLRKLPKQLCQQHLVQQSVLLHIIFHRTAASHAGSHTAVGRGHYPVRQAQFAAILLSAAAIEGFHLRPGFHGQDHILSVQLCLLGQLLQGRLPAQSALQPLSCQPDLQTILLDGSGHFHPAETV